MNTLFTKLEILKDKHPFEIKVILVMYNQTLRVFIFSLAKF